MKTSPSSTRDRSITHPGTDRRSHRSRLVRTTLSILTCVVTFAATSIGHADDNQTAAKPTVRIQKNGPARVVTSKTPLGPGTRKVGPRADPCGNSPTITSSDSTTFTVGNSENFTVTTSDGQTPIALFCDNNFPSGVTFQDNGDGTGSLYGTPDSGSGGVYNFTISAYSCAGDGAGTSQPFTLTVVEAPTITSDDNTTFTEGENGTFTVTTTGDSPISLSLSTDDLPAGVGFVDNGDGTATVSGTPFVGTASTYFPAFQACNNVDCVVQNFTLYVEPSSPSPSGSECLSPPGGMIGWWPGDGNLKDIVGGNNATNAGPGVTFATGEVGQAVSFNGTSDYVTVANSPDPNAEYSFDAWVYWKGHINASSHDGIVVKNNSSNDNDSYSMFIYAPNNSLYNVLEAHTYSSLSNTVPVNQWFHVAQTFDGSTANVYINGELAASYSGSRSASTGTLAFGNRAGGPHFFNGLIDEIETFSRALSQDEVRAIFNAGSFGKCKCTPPPADMIDWWPGDGNANDIRGLNDGTPQGDTTFAAGKVGQAFSFDGNGDYVDVGDVDLPTTFTIDAWINPVSLATSPYIITKSDLTTQGYHFSLFSDGHLILAVKNATGGSTAYKSTNPVVTTGTWQHVAATYDGNAAAGQRIKLFVNGASVPIVVIFDDGGTPLNNAVSTKIGIYGDLSSGSFNGLIDEVEVFSRALCADEIALLYSASSAGKCKPKLNVDYGTIISGNGSPVQAGFIGLPIPDNLGSGWFTNLNIDLLTAPTGVATLGIQGPTNFVSRDRNTTPSNSGGFTFSDLYRDFVLTSAPLQITLAGLTPNAVFDVTFYSYDDDAILGNPSTNTDTFANTTYGGSVPSASVTYGPGGGQVSSNHQYSTRLRVVSDASGNLSFNETSSGPEGGPVLNGLQVAPVPTANPCAAPTPAALQLANISSRADVGTGDKVAIAGFIVRTTQLTTRVIPRGNNPSKRVLIRGLGPSLPVSGQLADPVLDLFDSNGSNIGHNDNWQSDQESDINATGLAPSDPNEAAIITTLTNDNGYTAILSGAGHTSGIGLVEVYDIDPASPSRLANISTRAFVGTGDNVLIGGFIVRGGNAMNFLVRGIGPSLAPFVGAGAALPNPQVDLFDSNGTKIGHNDNWKEEPDGTLNSSRQTQITNTGLAPTNDNEAAILYPVPPPGAYTFIVSPAGSTPTGIGMVEVYEVDPTPK